MLKTYKMATVFLSKATLYEPQAFYIMSVHAHENNICLQVFLIQLGKVGFRISHSQFTKKRDTTDLYLLPF